MGLRGLQPRLSDVMSTSELDEIERRLSLSDAERFWMLNYNIFLQRGYKLRERYEEGVLEDFVDTIEEMAEEEAQALIQDACDTGLLDIADDDTLVEHGMDATIVRSGFQVWIKCYKLSDSENLETLQELALNLLLRSQPSMENHCLPIMDYFADQSEAALEFTGGSRYAFFVFPWAIPAWQHPWRLAAEAIEFVRQMIEGLVFLHDRGIAHRDIHASNILLDQRPMFPEGIDTRRSFMAWANFHDPSPCLDRIEVPVKYWYIDFGLSTRFDSDDHSVTWDGGMHKLPEVFGTTNPTLEQLLNPPEVRYDAFAGDIWQLGMTLHLMFGKSIPSLCPLLRAMTDRRPEHRPTVHECLVQFHALTDGLSRWELLWPVLDASPYRTMGDAQRVLRLDCLHFRDWARLFMKAIRDGLCKPEQMKHLPQEAANPSR